MAWGIGQFSRDELGVQSLIKPTHGRPSSKEPTGRYWRQMKRHLHNSRYGQRRQAETVFSMIKRCSGEGQVSRTVEFLLEAVNVFLIKM